ncbi:MAG: Response regulator containing CheY-like receiver,AAA-type ATPase, and DNA-binding domain, partial [candidate division NC10 bacterium]|nr:Response regulator containing CheY-like receiver,AAA-type ATPase, and DNA-binding domain [candidate division NC10 bacterium]
AVDAMKLGATDFVRKPMTPETLRNAVTAALAKPVVFTPVTVEPTTQKPTAQTAPPISRLTLNGFRFWADPNTKERQRREPSQRRFVVEHPDGRQQDVVAEITTEAIDFVEHATHRRLPPESAFWTSLAERCLNAFLWNDGRVPPGGKVTITAKDFDHDRLQLARLWED